MKTYAIADLHGRFDLLLSAYKRLIGGNHSGGTIVHLGDYVDRGPDSRQIIEFLMDPLTVPPGWKRVCLKGNHEAMMSQVCRTGGLVSWWMGNGGGRTLISFGHPTTGNVDVGIVPTNVLDWIDSLPLYIEDEHRVFVHAGVIDGLPLADHGEEILSWIIYGDSDESGYGDKHVVHGHHQFEDGPKLYAGRTDLDTLAWYTGRLVIGVFDDDKAGGPVSTIEVIGPTYDELMMEGKAA